MWNLKKKKNSRTHRLDIARGWGVGEMERHWPKMNKLYDEKVLGF